MKKKCIENFLTDRVRSYHWARSPSSSPISIIRPESILPRDNSLSLINSISVSSCFKNSWSPSASTYRVTGDGEPTRRSPFVCLSRRGVCGRINQRVQSSVILPQSWTKLERGENFPRQLTTPLTSPSLEPHPTPNHPASTQPSAPGKARMASKSCVSRSLFA